MPKSLCDEEIAAFLPMAAVSENGQIDFEEERPVSELKKGYTYFARGDVLVAKITPCFENGKAARTSSLTKPVGFGSTEFHVLRPGREVDPSYLFHLIWNSKFRDLGAKNMTGSAGQKRVPADFLRRLEIPLPPLPEQRRIAAILDKADALRRKRKRAIELLDSLTQSIFLEMFGDPVANPKNWPTTKFGLVGRLDRGVSKHRPRNDPELLGGEHPLIQTGDVANSGGYIRDYSSTYSDIGLRQSRKWPVGTLCITIAANIAQTGILTFPACFPDSVVGFTHENPNLVQYVRVWLSFLRSMLEKTAPTVAQKNINLEILRGLDMAMPSEPLVNEFGARLASQLRLHQLQGRDAEEIDLLFSSLQYRAFSGQL
jgi:type I restriction enzyme S subunit